jgi:hypothetical protein
MFRNKKITYLLIALVVLIWGLIFYKIYSNFGGNRQTKDELPQAAISAEVRQVDSIFTLSLDYPDPFLKGLGQPVETPVSNSGNTRIINWPPVEYRGLLSSNSKNGSTGLLKIQNSNLLVKQGKVYSAVKIRTITRDSIFLEFQNEKRWQRILK